MPSQLAMGLTSTAADPFAVDQFAKRNDRWLTPLPMIRALGEFDLDPCAAPGHETARERWTPEEVGDGLSMPWHGRVWLNPPYGRTMGEWIRALAMHGTGTALVFARTETALFHDWVWPTATALLFLKGRIVFATPDGSKPVANAPAPSVLIAYGRSDAEALERSGLPGRVVWLKTGPTVSEEDHG